RNTLQKNVNFQIVLLFGVPSLITAYVVRAFVLPSIPYSITEISGQSITKPFVLMILFAVVMLIAAVKMIRSIPLTGTHQSISKVKLMLSGIATGVLAGAVGAGGGFLIIPALVFLAALPMKEAVGTS